MSLVTKLLVILSFVWMPLSHAQDAWSLELVIREALDKNPAHKKVAEKVEEKNADVFAARSSYFPNLSALASAKTAKDAGNSSAAQFGATPYNSYTFELTGRQPLFRWGFFSGVSGTKKDREVAELHVRN